jgi:hypothetical protein
VCGQRGWSIVAEHLDDGVSGVATARQGLDALLADGDSGGAAFGSTGAPLRPLGTEVELDDDRLRWMGSDSISSLPIGAEVSSTYTRARRTPRIRLPGG